MAPTGYQPSTESFATAAPATSTQASGRAGYADSFATAKVIVVVDSRMRRHVLRCFAGLSRVLLPCTLGANAYPG